MGSVSSPRYQVVGQGEKASSDTRAYLDWILGKKFLPYEDYHALNQAVQGSGGRIIPGGI